MKNLSLRIKLTLMFLILAALVGMASFSQIAALQTINVGVSNLAKTDFVRFQTLDKLKQYAFEAKNEILHPQSSSRTQTVERLQVLKNLSTQAANTYSKTNDEPANITEMKAINSKVTAIIDKGIQLYQSLLPEIASQQNRQEAAAEIDSALVLIESASADVQAHLNTRQQDIADTMNRTIQITILSTGLVVCLAVLLGIITAARLARSLDRVRVGAQRIANGNFAEVIAVPSRDEIGQVAETFNQMSTRLKESYSRLAIEKQRDETILQNMGEGLIALDEKAQVVLINKVAAQLLDLGETNAAIGKLVYPLFDLYNQNKRKTIVHKRQHPVYEALSSGKPVNEIYNFKKQENHSIMINFSANPIILEKEVVGAIVVLRDVTHEREVDRMKTEFISLASHQLRTPLSAIKWFSEMLLSGDAGKLKGDQIDFAKNIADSTERMIELVNSLLNISRIESGRIMIDPKPTDLRELVGGIVTDLKAKTEERQQTLIVSVHADLPKINLDPRLIGQVYLNLLTNAIKYTPKGGEISVFISKKDDQVVSQVTDNGYGIPKEQQGRIFQKFFRAENVAKVETDGTGLGLYLIKAIVESSGGKIWFESKENKGTTFWFSIPLSGMKPKEGEVTLDA